jgi:hypothetical protein
MNIKVRLLQVGKKQVDLVSELRKRGFTGVQAPQVSAVINGHDTSPRGNEVREAIGEILTKWENAEQ